eukprot:1145558-Pelagomonas_calceolata.AAC.1
MILPPIVSCSNPGKDRHLVKTRTEVSPLSLLLNHAQFTSWMDAHHNTYRAYAEVQRWLHKLQGELILHLRGNSLALTTGRQGKQAYT